MTPLDKDTHSQIVLRVLRARKAAYVRAASARRLTLAEWCFEHLDRESRYDWTAEGDRTLETRQQPMTDNPNPLPPSACPVCGYVCDSATHVGEEDVRPRPNDFSVCLRCGEIVVFQFDLSFRPAEMKDFLNLPEKLHKTLEETQNQIRKTRPLGTSWTKRPKK